MAGAEPVGSRGMLSERRRWGTVDGAGWGGGSSGRGAGHAAAVGLGSERRGGLLLQRRVEQQQQQHGRTRLLACRLGRPGVELASRAEVWPERVGFARAKLQQQRKRAAIAASGVGGWTGGVQH